MPAEEKNKMSLDQRVKENDVRLRATKNSELDCRNCIFNNAISDLCCLSCDVFTVKPVSVLEGGKCNEKHAR